MLPSILDDCGLYSRLYSTLDNIFCHAEMIVVWCTAYVPSYFRHVCLAKKKSSRPQLRCNLEILKLLRQCFRSPSS